MPELKTSSTEFDRANQLAIDKICARMLKEGDFKCLQVSKCAEKRVAVSAPRR